MLKFIENIGDYFSTNFFNEDFLKQVKAKSGYGSEQIKALNQKMRGLRQKYFEYKNLCLEGNLRTKDRVTITHAFHGEVLKALGYEENPEMYRELYPLDRENEGVPVRQVLYRGGNQPHLFVMEMQALIPSGEESPKGIFEQQWHRSQWANVFNFRDDSVSLTPSIINEAVSALFLVEQSRRPQYVLLLAGNEAFLLHYEKWFRGSYLRFQLEELFAEGELVPDYFSLFYFLAGKEAIAPDAGLVLMEQLDEASHKSAYEVTKDLKEGIILAVEGLANEAVWYMQENGIDVQGLSRDFAGEMKNDCLTMVYRLLFIFYAESRAGELDILPMDDQAYERGYSLEILRDLEQVKLQSEESLNGYFFHESLTTLFRLLGKGYREGEVNNKSFSIRHLDSPLFDDSSLHHLDRVKFRNFIWQKIIERLSLSQVQGKKSRGRISYASLGINQLGSVYEGLLAYRGFFADRDYIEVHKANKPQDGTYVVPRSRLDEFDKDKEVLHDSAGKMTVIPKGKYIYRLSGRDRQKSASYYTPEVLTSTTVKYTLKLILNKLKGRPEESYDPPVPKKERIAASELLELKVLEPAMGAAAFHNEVINQLAEAYLDARQRELKKRIAPANYREELQRVKAYIATHNVYGVDLNPTAIELGKLSLWLNVIHKDMETPFFGDRLGAGNAVVGAWLKVYAPKHFLEEKVKGSQRIDTKKKKWWEKAPRHLKFKKGKLNRKPGEIYHFLLPDRNMLASLGIKLLKEKHPAAHNLGKKWLADFTANIRREEYLRLQALSDKIDGLLEDQYRFQQILRKATGTAIPIWGQADEGVLEAFSTYGQKAGLLAQREKDNSPYFKLKMVMDYWCALWFWDFRKAKQLPSRREWLEDLARLLDMDLADAVRETRQKETTTPGTGSFPSPAEQGQLFGGSTQHKQGQSRRKAKQREQALNLRAIRAFDNRSGLWENQRFALVQDYAERYRFFHYELEFHEVFREREGFDVIVGNPPWVKLEFHEKGVFSEKMPEVLIRNTSSSELRKIRDELLKDADLENNFFDEALEAECSSTFLNAFQNFPLLKGQQTNLYKCILENAFRLTAPKGYAGIIEPESVFDDPKGQPLRKALYPRLKYHFQFKNELSLFAEVHHETIYGSHVYSGGAKTVDFLSINNLFHPATIDGCFAHNGSGNCGGYKVFDEAEGKMVWNLRPHSDRLLRFTEEELRVLARTFENSDKWETTKLVSVHSRQILSVLEKLGNFPGKVKDVECKSTVCWDETNAVNAGIIRRQTKWPDIERNELIYSGPHFFVGNPLYKTPRAVCQKNSDYDEIDLERIGEDFVPRTNYVPDGKFMEKLKDFDSISELSWHETNRVTFRRRFGSASERSLIGGISHPETTHIHPVISFQFEDRKTLMEFCGISNSLVIDFYIKSTGRTDLYESTVNSFPLGLPFNFQEFLLPRVARLNLLTGSYAELWKATFSESWNKKKWSSADLRFSRFKSLQSKWSWHTPLRNPYERRMALVEIDVLTAMAFDLTLDELILIYEVQFPVLQQNEDDTWYDAKGQIVYTVSRGLTGTGVDRKAWESLRGELVQPGEVIRVYGPENETVDPRSGIRREGVKFVEERTYEGEKGMMYRGPEEGFIRHIIDPKKSELYGEQERIYYAPFDRCDRVADYRRAWAFFELEVNALSGTGQAGGQTEFLVEMIETELNQSETQ